MDDPAITRAKSRAELGLGRETTQTRTLLAPNPSIGGTRGFRVEERERALLALDEHQDYDLASETVGCCADSVRRWERRLTPYRMNGGAGRNNLVGEDQLLLSICLYIYPDASADEICTFIVANGGDVYSRPDITKRCNELGVTRKRSSRESYLAYTAKNVQKYLWFITLGPPLGVSSVRMARLIDIDETGFYLKSCSSKHGRGHSSCRVRYPGHYTRKEKKVNVVLGIEPGDAELPPNIDGSIQNPRRWILVTQDNCDQYNFGDFIDAMLTNLETSPSPSHLDDQRCLMWDNLSVHKTPYVTNVIHGRESNNHFFSVNRPPYRPKIAPIEFVFCELAAELERRVQADWTIDSLRFHIYDICSTIGRGGSFHSTFIHCGYPH